MEAILPAVAVLIAIIVGIVIGYRAGYQKGTVDGVLRFENGIKRLSKEIWERKQESDKEKKK